MTIDANGKNDKVEVTLDNVNIKADSGSALTSKGDVTLTLKGDNSLTGGNGGSGISSSGSLTISGGTVNATGGSSSGGMLYASDRQKEGRNDDPDTKRDFLYSQIG